jgi:hypothetical protein
MLNVEQTEKSKRQLKVCYGYNSGSNKPHPLINLGGHYLKKFGFNVGDFVELTIEKGQIVIKKVE